MKITFISKISDPTLPNPIPAVKQIPDWYKSLERYSGGIKRPVLEANQSSGTIKTCMPVLDSITSGYLILSPCDLFVSKQGEETIFQWPSHDLIAFHGNDQVKGYPSHKEKYNNSNLPKFNNPWIVKTPKNYSCLFIQPMHRDLPFTILPGVVDTDTYVESVNFPFRLDPNFEGLIPKGTPIAQVLPFRRNSWSMNIASLNKQNKYHKQWISTIYTLKSEYFDRYKKHFWSKKSYR
jgi:hypothetical protein